MVHIVPLDATVYMSQKTVCNRMNTYSMIEKYGFKRFKQELHFLYSFSFKIFTKGMPSQFCLSFHFYLCTLIFP